MSPAPPPTLALNPGPIPAGGRAKWKDSGRTLSHALCPGTSQLALFATVDSKDRNPTVPPTSTKGASSFPGDRAVFVARWDAVPHHLVPLYSRSYTIFQSLQQIAAQTASGEAGEGFASASSGLPSAAQVNFYSRVCSLYIDTIRQHLLPPASPDDASLPSSLGAAAAPAFPEADLAHWTQLASTLHLARILYMPSDGRGEGVVGEELLDWVNLADCGPTEEEGAEILDAGGGEAWRHDEFWSYLIRSLLRGFLNSASQLLLTLSTHPSPPLASLAPRLSAHLLAYPRSSSEAFSTERAFLSAHAQWRAGLRLLARPLTRGWTRAGWVETSDAEVAAAEENVAALLGVLAGEEARVLAESAEWKEALGAFGVWVRPGLKRDDLPATVAQILSALPLADPEDAEPADEGEEIQTLLLSGDCVGAATLANASSLYLAVHLSDLLSHLALLPTPAGSKPLRDHYVLEYAAHLAADPALWKVACEYAGSVGGEEGRGTVRALLEAVSLDKEVEEGQEGGEGEPEVDQDKVEEVLKLMHTHTLEEPARALARTVAERLVGERKFGLAVAFAVRAGDTGKLEGIADRILDVYVRRGPDEFLAHVQTLPTSLLDPTLASTVSPPLAFLPLYAQFLAAYAQGDRAGAAALLVQAFRGGLAPKAFWAVLMVDFVPLLDDPAMLVPTDAAFLVLSHLEDLLTSSLGAPSAYLAHLANLRSPSEPSASIAPSATAAAAVQKGSEDDKWRDVRKGLDVVRLALARYLARDLTVG